MAIKIVWTKTAIDQVIAVYKFWNENNQSTSYSKRLEKEIKKQEKILFTFPNAGTITNNPKYRVMVVEHFKLFYRVEKDVIYILSFFDSRQHPDKLIE